MAGLPDDLRSAVRSAVGQPNVDPKLILQAADRIDADAARILRLEQGLRAMMTRGQIALERSSSEIGPEERLVPHPDDCKCGRCIGKPRYGPAMTPTEDPTRMPIIFDAGVLPGEIEVRFGGKLVCKITGIGK